MDGTPGNATSGRHYKRGGGGGSAGGTGGGDGANGIVMA